MFKELVLAVIMVESSGNPKAMNPSGAVGLMQTLPIAVAQVQQDLGIYRYTPNLFNPAVSIFYGSKYLEYCLEKTNNLAESLICYNAGYGWVVKYRATGKLPRETYSYIGKVLRRMRDENQRKKSLALAEKPSAK